MQELTTQQIQSFSTRIEAIRAQIGRQIIGQREVVDALITALIVGGNVLLEGVPGLGKTRLVRTIGDVFKLPFSRIQFTPDLMPADITGTSIITKGEGGNEFRFQPGPLFASIVLADEINRATPKTQSALLEAMQEHSVTVGGETRKLPAPYFVLATQNPIEQEGTYPLPEAQLDRFLFKVVVEFPTMEELTDIVALTVGSGGEPAQPVSDGDELLQMREIARQVPIARAVMAYALQLVVNTHPELPQSPAAVRKYLRFGASPRAAQALIGASRVRALMMGRYNVSFEDVKALAPLCLRHRLALNFEGLADGQTPDSVIAAMIDQTPRE